MPAKNFWAQVASYLSANDVCSMLIALSGAAVGRIVHWKDHEKRMPLVREAALEPFVVLLSGTATAGVLSLFSIDSPLAIGGISALSGFYGISALDMLLGVVATRLGMPRDACKIKSDKD